MLVTVCNLLSLFLSLGAQGLVRVPIKRIQPPDASSLQTYVNNMKTSNTGPRYLKDYGYVSYVGEIGLGTPVQKLKVIFDTATPALWVSSRKFVGLKSSSFQNSSDCKVTRPYSTGNFVGLNKKDVLVIGGASVKSQAFEWVMTGLEDKQLDGIFGLAFPSPSPVCGPEVTPLQNMAVQGISPAVFSFRYDKDPYSTTPDYDGEIIFGIDKEYVDEASLEYIQLSNKANWQIAIDSVTTFNGFPVCKEGCQAIIDSASPVIAGPIEEVDLLYQHITGGCSYHNGTYEINCQSIENLPVLTFTINGIEYDLYGPDYVLRFPSRFGTTCISSLVGMNLPGKTWLLGDAFMKRFYTVFDQEKGRVAFGRLKDDYYH